VQPQINVGYFSLDFDLDVHVASARLTRRVLQEPPLRCDETLTNITSALKQLLCSLIAPHEVAPGKSVPVDSEHGSDYDWKNWIKGNYTGTFHPVGSAAMMRRDLGGNEH
jgi:choline dehydrogenase